MRPTTRTTLSVTCFLLGVVSASAGIVKTSSGGGGPVSPGDTLTYTIVVTNDDVFTWDGLVVSDPVPNGTTAVAGSTVVTAPEPSSDNYRDEFTTGDYGGSAGTLDWSPTQWVEFGDDGSPLFGDLVILTDPLGAPNATPPQLRVKDISRGVDRALDLSSFPVGTSARLTFSYRREGLDNANDYAEFQVSTDGGGSFIPLPTSRVQGPALNDGIYIANAPVDLTAFTGQSVILRLTSSAALGNNDIIYYDNIDVAVTVRPQAVHPGCDPSPLVGVATTCDGTERPVGVQYNLLPGETMTITFDVVIDLPLSPSILEIVNDVTQTNNQLPNIETSQTRDQVLQEPDVLVQMCPMMDVCGAGGDGDVDPNDLLFYTVRFYNQGNLAATDFRASFSAAGAVIRQGGTVGGTPLLNLAAGATYDHSLAVEVTGACGDTVAVDVVGLVSDSGTYMFADDLSSCHVRVEPGPPTCDTCFRPDVQLASCPVVDQCGGVSDGEIDPDDRLTYTLTFVNMGNADAFDFQGSVLATGATIASGGTIGGGPPIDLAVSDTYDHTVVADVTVPCAGLVDLNVTSLRSDGGTITYFDEPTLCDVTVELPGPSCVGCPPIPTVAVTACPFVDLCSGVGDGEADPGDQVTATITFTNWGRSPAVGFTADVTIVAGGTAVSGQTVGPLDIPGYDTYDHQLVLDVTGLCGETLDIDVTNLQSDAGTFLFPDETALCDLPIGTSDCNPCSCIATPPTGDLDNALVAIKTGVAFDDVELSWMTSTVNPPSFVVYSTDDKMELAETPTGIGDENQLTVPSTSSLIYLDVGAVSSATNPLHYEVLAADNCDNPIYP